MIPLGKNWDAQNPLIGGIPIKDKIEIKIIIFNPNKLLFQQAFCKSQTFKCLYFAIDHSNIIKLNSTYWWKTTTN